MTRLDSQDLDYHVSSAKFAKSGEACNDCVATWSHLGMSHCGICKCKCKFGKYMSGSICNSELSKIVPVSVDTSL